MRAAPCVRAMLMAGKFTELTTLPFCKKSMSWSAAIMAQFSSASAVLAPMCGMGMTLSWLSKPGSGKSHT